MMHYPKEKTFFVLTHLSKSPYIDNVTKINIEDNLSGFPRTKDMFDGTSTTRKLFDEDTFGNWEEEGRDERTGYDIERAA